MKNIKHNLPLLTILLLTIILYINTLWLDYALDDRLVIFENEYTLKGFGGIKDVLTKDGFSGFFKNDSNLVAGGRYRPLSQISFILEYEFFGSSVKGKIDNNLSNEELLINAHLPVVSHLINLLLYLLLIIVVYKSLLKLFNQKKMWYASIPFIATLLFALHPLHIEAVANIKGRDEILSMIGGFVALWASLKYCDKQSYKWLLLSFISILLGIFSKENCIVFFLIIPLSIYFYSNDEKIFTYISSSIPILTAIIIFLIMRTVALGEFMPKDTSNSILNNPFINCSATEKFATIILTWGIYLKLILFPHPLTHDYYPHCIEITNFANPIVAISVILTISVIIYAVINLKRKSIVTYGIIFFILSFSIVSNLLFSVGTFMNERFMFTPLLGITIIAGYFLSKLSSQKIPKYILPVILTVLTIGYEVKGISRNLVWKNDFTLFTTDVIKSSNSIKCNVSAGGNYLQHFKKSGKDKDLQQAIRCLNKAVKLDNYNYYGHALLGEAYFLQKNYQLSYQYFKNAFAIKPTDQQAQNNLYSAEMMMGDSQMTEIDNMLLSGNPNEALQMINRYISSGNIITARVYNEKGKIFGMGLNRLDSSYIYLKKSLSIDSNFIPALENMGVLHALQNKFDAAMSYFLKANSLDTSNASIKRNISLMLEAQGKKSEAAKWKQ